MDERHIAAAAAIIEGKSIEEAAKAAHRVPKTIYAWAEEPDFQAVVLRGIHAKALLTVAAWVNGGATAAEGAAALAIVKWMGAPRRSQPFKKKEPPVDDDETDLGEFSQEQLERLRGEE